ncbi:transferrin-binding protein-like solute binding protein [Ursidibacter sp. B-7004-1]
MKTSLAVIISSFLTACGGTKGDFGVEDVDIKKIETEKTTTKDIKTTPREKQAEAEGIMQPALGYEIKIPVRNIHPQNKEDHIELKTEDIKKITDDNLEIPHFGEITRNGESVIYTHNPSGKPNEARTMQYVRSGYVANIFWRDSRFSDKIYKQGPDGYVYYRGTNPSTSIPSNLKATYNGTWDFVTDAKDGRNTQENGFNADSYRPGNRAGASSFNDRVHNTKGEHKIGHTSEFQVDFGNKTLTGKLYKNTEVTNQNPTQESILRYTIDANISGNRFKGKATAKDTDNEIFKQNSDYLEGGFYGPNSEELAGKFLANDNSLFAVFAGKRNAAENEEVEKRYDAIYIPLDNFTAKDLNTFGDIDKLIIDGKTYDLATNNNEFVTYKTYDENPQTKASICCGNLDYVKFGSLGVESKTNYFLQGERTATKDIPTGGEVKYKGTWEGYISDNSVWTTSANNTSGGSRAEFNVDFKDKKISGTLIAEERVSPSFIILGKLDGNSFNATASTGENGFNLDPSNTNNSKVVHLKDLNVRGGFFGENASELGGSFHSAESKVGVVFGAKRQVNE